MGGKNKDHKARDWNTISRRGPRSVSRRRGGAFRLLHDLLISAAAVRARRLQADATTPRVRQYFDKMIAHCERLAGKVEPGVSPARSATSGRAKRFIIGPRSSKSMTRSY